MKHFRLLLRQFLWWEFGKPYSGVSQNISLQIPSLFDKDRVIFSPLKEVICLVGMHDNYCLLYSAIVPENGFSR